MNVNVRDLYEEAGEEILSFKNSRHNFLNVISLPYNNTAIFIKLVMNSISSKKKILYITNEKKDEINLLKLIVKENKLIKHSYFDISSDKHVLESDIVFTNHKNAIKIGRVFDLIVYDDLSAYSYYTKFEILGLLSRCVKDKSTKIIAYSYASIFNIENEVYIPVYESGLPVAEPRVMTTRVNTMKEIPNCAFEYLQYSVRMENSVVIYIPKKDILISTYNYLRSVSDKLTEKIYILADRKDEEPLVKLLNEEKRMIILTCDFEEKLYSKDREVDYLIFFNEILNHNKKKLLFICGKASENEMEKRGEVIFLANDVGADIDFIKNTTRKFNESGWKLGLLKF